MPEPIAAADTPTAASATAPEPSSSDILASLTREQYETWSKTGELPTDTPPASALAAETKPAETPAASPETTKPEIAAAAAPPPLSRKERDQQEINERIRTAVEKATADLRARLDTYERHAAPRPAPETPEATPTVAEYKRYLAMPDAPKLDAFDSIEEFQAAMSVFVFDKRAEERDYVAKQASEQDARTQALTTRNTAFYERISKAKEAEPTFLDGISAEVKALKPFDALERLPDGRWRDPDSGRFVAPGLAALAEELLASPVAPAVMRHFTEHPEELATLGALAPRELLKAFGKLEARLDKAAEPPAHPPVKTVTDVPPPPTTLGERPAAPVDETRAAVERGDFTAFSRAADQRDLAAARTGIR